MMWCLTNQSTGHSVVPSSVMGPYESQWGWFLVGARLGGQDTWRQKRTVGVGDRSHGYGQGGVSVQSLRPGATLSGAFISRHQQGQGRELSAGLGVGLRPAHH